MGVYELTEGKVVSGRAVWQKQGGGEGRFLYYSSMNTWVVSDSNHMDAGGADGFMLLSSAALTPDQARPSEMWQGGNGTQFVANPEVQVRRQQ
jgi:hypothetical protein